MALAVGSVAREAGCKGLAVMARTKLRPSLWPGKLLVGRGRIAEFDLGDRSTQGDGVNQLGIAGIGRIDGCVFELPGPVFHFNGGAEAVALGVREHSIGAIHLHLVRAGSELQRSNLRGLGQSDTIGFAGSESEAGKS